MSSLIPFDKKNSEIQRRHSNFFDVERIFENFFNDDFFPSFFRESSQMRVDIKENEKEYVLEADLPGVKKEDITIEINDNRLTISAKNDESVEEQRENYIRKERKFSSMVRSFGLENVKSDKITAKHENGVLTLILPKVENKGNNGRRIEIN